MRRYTERKVLRKEKRQKNKRLGKEEKEGTTQGEKETEKELGENVGREKGNGESERGEGERRWSLRLLISVLSLRLFHPFCSFLLYLSFFLR